MIRKCIYKIFFKESFINDMLDKGWEPIQFKNLGCCIFKQCVPRRYNCKLIFMNRTYKSDYVRLYNQIDAIKNDKDVKVIQLKDADPTVNFYYVIYEKGKKLSDEFNVYADTDYINKVNKWIKVLAIRICGGIVYVASFTTLVLLHLNDTTNLLWHILGIIGPICGSIYTVSNIREFLIIKYIYNKYF